MIPRFLREPFEDASSKRPSHSVNYEALDGLRGLAAVMVLTDHWYVLNNDGRGIVGVLIFFVLSGFLLSLPFNQGRPVVPNFKFISNFFVRRFRRIYPLFFICLFIMFYPLDGIMRPPIDYGSASNKFVMFAKYALFLTRGGHFWTVSAEVYFYAILPVIFCVNHWVFRENKTAIILWLVVAAWYWSTIRSEPAMLVTLNPDINPRLLQLYFDAFFLGVASCYAAYQLNRTKFVLGWPFQVMTTAVGFFCVIFFIFGNDLNIKYTVAPLSPTVAQWLKVLGDTWYVAILAAVVILAILLNGKGRLARFFSHRYLRVLGVVGYSLYLVHPNVLPLWRISGIKVPTNDFLRFVIFFAITFVGSCVTYTYIEKPFMKTRR